MKVNSITESGQWDSYFSNQQLSTVLYKHYITDVMNRYIWSLGPGDIFEMGSAGSRLLIRSALKGWRISGIDFHKGGNDLLRKCLTDNDLPVGDIIDDDVCKHDCEYLAGRFDALISSTFFCHFKEPAEIIKKWRLIVKPGGIVLTIMPNLDSINGLLMKKYDPCQWNSHIVYSPKEIDSFHERAGLSTVIPAYYTGGYDPDFYVPWGYIKNRLKPLLLYRLLRYFVSYVVRPVSGLLPFSGSKTFNRHIIGVYRSVDGL